MYHHGATETRELTAARLLHQIPIVVNAAAGSVTDSEDVCKRLCRAFSAVGCQVECRTLHPENIGRYLRILIDERPVAVGVAGADGTMSSCATALAGTDIALVPLPLGTRNHFAQDLGVPLNLEDAARALAGGRIHAIDMGQVNGQLFLNNASVGLYTRAVRWRGSLLAEDT